jgi:purine nucleosidase
METNYFDSEPTKKNVLFSHDGSTDDNIALILLLLNRDKVNLLGIIVNGSGETHVDDGVVTTLKILSTFNALSIPVTKGQAKSLDATKGLPFPLYIREAVDKLGQFFDADVSNYGLSVPFEQFMKECYVHSKDIVILSTGTLTDLAIFFKNFPKYIDQTKCIYLMGGAIAVKGNVADLNQGCNNVDAECNIFADPVAASVLFQLNIPMIITPLDLTNEFKVTEAYFNQLKALADAFPNKPVKYIYLMINYLKTCCEDSGIVNFFEVYYLWDPLTAYILLFDVIAISKVGRISVDIENGKTTFIEDDKGNVTWPTALKLSADQILNHMLRIFQTFDHDKVNGKYYKQAKNSHLTFFNEYPTFENTESTTLLKKKEEKYSFCLII